MNPSHQHPTFDDIGERFLIFVVRRSERADEHELGEESRDVLEGRWGQGSGVRGQSTQQYWCEV